MRGPFPLPSSRDWVPEIRGHSECGVWFGAAVFFTFGAGRRLLPGDMVELLGTNNFPFFSGAIAQIIATRFFTFHLVCAVVAVLHLSG